MSRQGNSLSDVALCDMMVTLGMEPAGAPVPRFGHILASGWHACVACRSVQECRAWLAAAAHRKSTAAPEFCPDRELLAEFRLEPLMYKLH